MGRFPAPALRIACTTVIWLYSLLISALQTDHQYHHDIGYPTTIRSRPWRQRLDVIDKKFHPEDNERLCHVDRASERRDFLGEIATFLVSTIGGSIAMITTPGMNPAWGTTLDPNTGIRLPDVGEIETSIPRNWNDIDNPFIDDPKLLFSRLDTTSDSKFYQEPRFVEHVDDNAVKLLTDYISNVAIRPGGTVLDLCSSWTSHVDVNIAKQTKRISGLGMNSKELESNPILTDWIVQDLNENPYLLKYEDNTFDVVLCQLSIDYLTQPLEVLKDVGRILKPGGSVHILFSNRLFLSKAVGIWTGGDDIDHAYTIGCYLHFCNGGFQDITAQDLSTRKGGKNKRIVGDPLFVVTAIKG